MNKEEDKEDYNTSRSISLGLWREKKKREKKRGGKKGETGKKIDMAGGSGKRRSNGPTSDVTQLWL